MLKRSSLKTEDLERMYTHLKQHSPTGWIKPDDFARFVAEYVNMQKAAAKAEEEKLEAAAKEQERQKAYEEAKALREAAKQDSGAAQATSFPPAPVISNKAPPLSSGSGSQQAHQ